MPSMSIVDAAAIETSTGDSDRRNDTDSHSGVAGALSATTASTGGERLRVEEDIPQGGVDLVGNDDAPVSLVTRDASRTVKLRACARAVEQPTPSATCNCHGDAVVAYLTHAMIARVRDERPAIIAASDGHGQREARRQHRREQ